jgi:UDP-N-acetylmuramyl pentapeptide phosphotransferase/UDP-N-acetylglucosamine-1-phosphate transferase
MPDVLLPAISAFIVALAVTTVVERVSRRRGLLDEPNDRSSHVVPTPRIGGIGVVAGVASGWVVAAGWHDPAWPALVAGAGVLALVGLADDLGWTSLIGKYLAQVGGATVVTVAYDPSLAISAGTASNDVNGMPAAIITVVWLTAIINAFNFIDGIDGMLASIVVVASVVGTGLVAGSADANLVVVAAAALGFLAWNHAPASIFMGDVGSQFLGLWVGASLLRSPGGVVEVVPILLLFGVVLLDTGSTLLRRAIARKNLFAAHREHLYQRLVAAGASQRAISAFYAAITTALGAGALLWGKLTISGQIALLLAAVIGGGLLLVMVRRVERRTGAA